MPSADQTAPSAGQLISTLTPPPAGPRTPAVSVASISERASAGLAAATERLPWLASDRPEVAAGKAFAGGLLLAMILRRLAG